MMRVYDKARTGALLRARQLRRDSTEAEKRLLRALRSRLPDYKWRHQMPIGPYFVDLVYFSERLVIELDGGQHSSAPEYDAARTRFIESQGFRVLRFWNNDVLGNTDGVVEQISLSLGRGREQRQLRKGEVDATLSPSPSHSAAPSGPLPLPVGEGN